VSTIGSDEVGKGDYFGSLVVAAVFADTSQTDELASMRVADSKTLSDTRIQTLAGHIEQRFAHQVVSVMPRDYNPMHQQIGNLNRLLVRLHGQAISGLLRSQPQCAKILVDKFADERLLMAELREQHARLPEVVQVPRAEAHPVVAAASIVARARFLADLRECEQLCATDLHKGAGPEVDKAGRRVLAVGGRALLGQVAKLHFKNTAKLRVSR
jgi:ribonuclease HIII